MTRPPATPPARRPAHVADHALWDEVRRTVKPLRAGADADIPAHDHRPSAAEATSAPPAPRRVSSAAPAPLKPPALTGLDRRTSQRMARGQVEIDARIDLHGLSLEVARVRLAHFLAGARAHDHRIVLVITGKGESPFARHTLHGTNAFHAPERPGRLRRALAEWLAEPELRAHVSGFQPAHPRHGGGGAFYVRLRRQERHR